MEGTHWKDSAVCFALIEHKHPEIRAEKEKRRLAHGEEDFNAVRQQYAREVVAAQMEEAGGYRQNVDPHELEKLVKKKGLCSHNFLRASRVAHKGMDIELSCGIGK